MMFFPKKFGIRFNTYSYYRMIGIIFSEYRFKIYLYKYMIEIGMIEDYNWKNNIKVSVMNGVKDEL